FDTAKPAMGLGISATLVEDRRGSAQSLQALGRLIATAIIADFGKQSRSQTHPCPRQGQKAVMVLMLKKKALDLLIIGRDLLDQRFQLIEDGQRQSGFSARGDLIRLQCRLLELSNDA